MICHLRHPFPSTILAIAAVLAATVLPAVLVAAERPAAVESSGSSGNIALLVLADRSQPQEYLVLQTTILAALGHFGMPFQVLDLSQETLTADAILSHSAVVLGQPGTGKRLSAGDVSALEKALASGVGLVNFDGMLSAYPAAYRQLLGVESTDAANTSAVRIAQPPHPITQACDSERRYALVRPVPLTSLGSVPGAAILLETEEKLPAAFALERAQGRIVQFALAPEFWLPDYFGHVHGLDGLFWRSIVWAARKPFVMMAMPPFVTARIDDASGSGSSHLVNDSAAKGFHYIDTLNQFGYIPNVGLFTDDITDDDGKILKQKADQGLAEFSAHAWTNDRHIYVDRVSDEHGTRMVEFSPEELGQRFAKLDGQFARWGIRPSRTLNSHCFSPGRNALPFLKERGEMFMMFAGRFGMNYYDPAAFAWGPKPYGDPGFTFDYMPDDPDFFNVEAHPYTVRDGKITDADIDFLWKNTTFAKEAKTNRLDVAAERGIEEIRLGLDSLFFGCLMTHEQRIASLTLNEWQAIVSQIDKATSNWDKIFASYDHISEYAKSRYDTKLLRADCDGHAIHVTVAGRSTVPLKLYLFSAGGLEYEFREIPVFQGEQSVVLSLSGPR